MCYQEKSFSNFISKKWLWLIGKSGISVAIILVGISIVNTITSPKNWSNKKMNRILREKINNHENKKTKKILKRRLGLHHTHGKKVVTQIIDYGWAYLKMGENEELINMIDQVLEKHTSIMTPRSLLLMIKGDALRELGQRGEAVAVYKKAMSIPHDEITTFDLQIRFIEILREYNRLDEAAEKCQAYIEKLARRKDYDRMSVFMLNLGDVYSDQGNLEQAKKQYKMIISHDDISVNSKFAARIGFMDVLLKEKKYDVVLKKVDELMKNVTCKEQYQELLFVKANTLNDINKKEAAKQIYQDIFNSTTMLWLKEEAKQNLTDIDAEKSK